MSENIIVVGLIVLVCLVALGLGFVVLVTRGGRARGRVGMPGVTIAGEMEAGDEAESDPEVAEAELKLVHSRS